MPRRGWERVESIGVLILRWLFFLGCGLCLLLPTWSGAWAAPRNGIGLAIGPAAHSFFLPARPADIEFDSAGIGLTADAQFVWTENWSINPAVVGSLEKSTNGPVDRDVESIAAILQVRYWSGDFYLGAHVGIYKSTIRSEIQTLFTEEGGIGMAAGYETGSGLIFNFQLDNEQVLSGNNILAARLLAGYRWN